MQSSSARQSRSAVDRLEVRIIHHSDDPFAGLKGHDYIKARKLNPPVQKVVQTSAQSEVTK